jgi:hypothetical protein
MKNFRIGIYLKIILLILTSYHAQAQTDKELITKKIKLQLLEKTLVDYYLNATVSNNRQINDFSLLFTDESNLIFNDILPENKQNTSIKVEEYYKKVSENYNGKIEIEIVPNQVDIIELDEDYNGEGVVNCSKIIKGKNKEFDVIYEDTLDIDIIFKFSYTTQSYLIKTIKLHDVTNFTNYTVICPYEKGIFSRIIIPNDTFKINNQLIKSNQLGAFLLKSKNNGGDIVIMSNTDVLLGKYTLNYSSLINLKSKKLYFYQSYKSIEPYFSMLGINSTIVKADNLKSNSNNSYEFGVNFKLILLKSKNKNTAYKFRTGIGYTNLSMNILFGSLNFETKNLIDPYNINYTRRTTINDIDERQQIKAISIPLLLEIDQKLSKKISVFINGGINYINILSAQYQSNAKGNYSGYYPDYYG